MTTKEIEFELFYHMKLKDVLEKNTKSNDQAIEHYKKLLKERTQNQ